MSSAAVAELEKLRRKFLRWERHNLREQGIAATSGNRETRMGFFGAWMASRDAAMECEKAVARLRKRARK